MIIKTLDICGGRARIGGTRMPVWVLAKLVMDVETDQEILDLYPYITSGDLRDAYGYILRHPEEIATDIRENSSDNRT